MDTIIPAPPIIRVTPLVDLAAAQRALPRAIRVGQQLTYTITVANRTGATATDATVDDLLAGRFALVSVKPTRGHCTRGARITCFLEAIPGGGRAAVRLVVQPTRAGVLTNTVELTGEQFEARQANNHSRLKTRVFPRR